MHRNDRRIFDRFAVDFSCEIKQLGTQTNSMAECCDIGAGGAGLLNAENVIPNTRLELGLGIPNGHPPFCGLGRVVWAKQVQENKWRLGIEFEQVNFMGIRRIFALLKT